MHAIAVVLVVVLAAGIVVLVFRAAVVARRLGYKVGGDVVVRCREGHLFTTIWIPGGSFKAIRLGLVRFQYCPVGEHWTFVTPVRDSDLTDAEGGWRSATAMCGCPDEGAAAGSTAATASAAVKALLAREATPRTPRSAVPAPSRAAVMYVTYFTYVARVTAPKPHLVAHAVMGLH